MKTYKSRLGGFKAKKGAFLGSKKGVVGGALCFNGSRVPVKSVLFLFERKKISAKTIAIKYYPWLSYMTIDKGLEEYYKYWLPPVRKKV